MVVVGAGGINLVSVDVSTVVWATGGGGLESMLRRLQIGQKMRYKPINFSFKQAERN